MYTYTIEYYYSSFDVESSYVTDLIVPITCVHV